MRCHNQDMSSLMTDYESLCEQRLVTLMNLLLQHFIKILSKIPKLSIQWTSQMRPMNHTLSWLGEKERSNDVGLPGRVAALLTACLWRGRLPSGGRWPSALLLGTGSGSLCFILRHGELFNAGWGEVCLCTKMMVGSSSGICRVWDHIVFFWNSLTGTPKRMPSMELRHFLYGRSVEDFNAGDGAGVSRTISHRGPLSICVTWCWNEPTIELMHTNLIMM